MEFPKDKIPEKTLFRSEQSKRQLGTQPRSMISKVTEAGTSIFRSASRQSLQATDAAKLSATNIDSGAEAGEVIAEMTRLAQGVLQDKFVEIAPAGVEGLRLDPAQLADTGSNITYGKHEPRLSEQAVVDTLCQTWTEALEEVEPYLPSAATPYIRCVLGELSRAMDGYAPHVPSYNGPACCRRATPHKWDPSDPTIYLMHSSVLERFVETRLMDSLPPSLQTGNVKRFLMKAIHSLQHRSYRHLVRRGEDETFAALRQSGVNFPADTQAAESYFSQALCYVLDGHDVQQRLPPPFPQDTLSFDGGADRLDQISEALFSRYLTLKADLVKKGVPPPCRDHSARRYLRAAVDRAHGFTAQQRHAATQQRAEAATNAALPGFSGSLAQHLQDKPEARAFIAKTMTSATLYLEHDQVMQQDAYPGAPLPLPSQDFAPLSIEQQKAPQGKGMQEAKLRPQQSPSTLRQCADWAWSRLGGVASVTSQLGGKALDYLIASRLPARQLQHLNKTLLLGLKQQELLKHATPEQIKAIEAHFDRQLKQLLGLDRSYALVHGSLRGPAVEKVVDALEVYAEENFPREAVAVFVNQLISAVGQITSGLEPPPLVWTAPPLSLAMEDPRDAIAQTVADAQEALLSELGDVPNKERVETFVRTSLRSLVGQAADSLYGRAKESVKAEAGKQAYLRLAPSAQADVWAYLSQAVDDVSRRVAQRLLDKPKLGRDAVQNVALPVMNHLLKELSSGKPRELLDPAVRQRISGEIAEKLLAVVFSGSHNVPLPTLRQLQSNPLLAGLIKAGNLEISRGAILGILVSQIEKKQGMIRERLDIHPEALVALLKDLQGSAVDYDKTFQRLIFQILHTLIADKLDQFLEELDDPDKQMHFINTNIMTQAPAKLQRALQSKPMRQQFQVLRQGASQMPPKLSPMGLVQAKLGRLRPSLQSGKVAIESNLYGEVGERLLNLMLPKTTEKVKDNNAVKLLANIAKLGDLLGRRDWIREEVNTYIGSMLLPLLEPKQLQPLLTAGLEAGKAKMERTIKGEENSGEGAKLDRASMQREFEESIRTMSDTLIKYLNERGLASKAAKDLGSRLINDKELHGVTDEIAKGILILLQNTLTAETVAKLMSGALDQMLK